jgi:ATP-dependent helicase Lhr and Lhr-like helicase
VISAADPLNLVGILTPEARVPAVHTNRLLLEDGLPIAALEGGEVRRLSATVLGDDALREILTRRHPRRALQLHPRTPRGREAEALAKRTLH